MKKKSLAASAAARKAKRTRMFGANAVCILCRYSNPVALIEIDKTLLQEHHVNGQAHDPVTLVPVCLNCHAELHAGMRDNGTSLEPKRSLLEKLAEMHRAREVFARAEANAHAKIADQLDEYQLDLYVQSIHAKDNRPNEPIDP